MLVFDAADARVRFALVLDRVMGGRSTGQVTNEQIEGRPAARLRGEVSLDNGGGFVQMAADVEVDASTMSTLRLLVHGNGETYGCHVKTPDIRRPWQSYRQTFVAPSTWTWVELPIDQFRAHRTEAPFDRSRIRRLGLVAIGRPFTADLAVTTIELV